MLMICSWPISMPLNCLCMVMSLSIQLSVIDLISHFAAYNLTIFHTGNQVVLCPSEMLAKGFTIISDYSDSHFFIIPFNVI